MTASDEHKRGSGLLPGAVKKKDRQSKESAKERERKREQKKRKERVRKKGDSFSHAALKWAAEKAYGSEEESAKRKETHERQGQRSARGTLSAVHKEGESGVLGRRRVPSGRPRSVSGTQTYNRADEGNESSRTSSTPTGARRTNPATQNATILYRRSRVPIIISPALASYGPLMRFQPSTPTIKSSLKRHKKPHAATFIFLEKKAIQ